MIKIIHESFADISYYQEKYEDYIKLSESAHAVLICFKDAPEMRLRPKEIILMTQLPRRTVSHVLADLVTKKFIQKFGQHAGARYQLVF